MSKHELTMQIFTVDNEKYNVQLILALLQEAGFSNTRGFYSAIDLLSEMETNLPDLILSDIMMPDMSGYELCKLVKSNPNWAHIPIIMITATSLHSSDPLKLSFDYGAMDFINKPINNIELAARVTSALKIEHQRQQLERALEEVKALKGLLPICSYCKKIRSDDNYWQEIENYISEHSEAEFSHSICPNCYQTHVLPELEEVKKKFKK